MCVFPDILAVDNQIPSEGLLNAGMKFIPESGIDRTCITGTESGHHRVHCRIVAPDACEDKILIEWCFHRPRVGHAQDGIRRLHVVRDTGARLHLAIGGQAAVKIGTQPKVKRPVVVRDRVLEVCIRLFDRGGS